MARRATLARLAALAPGREAHLHRQPVGRVAGVPVRRAWRWTRTSSENRIRPIKLTAENALFAGHDEGRSLLGPYRLVHRDVQDERRRALRVAQEHAGEDRRRPPAIPNPRTPALELRLGTQAEPEANRPKSGGPFVPLTKLRHRACIEDIDFRQPRGLDKDLVLSLADGRWIREHLNCLITGPAGIGKSWIACALAHGACRNGYSAAYRRLTRLLTELSIARADGRYPKLLASLAKTQVLVIDDFGLAKLSAENRRDLLEIIETDMGYAQPSSPASSRSKSGTPSSGTRPWPTPSSTASCTARTSSLERRIDAKTTPGADPNDHQSS